MFRQRIRYLAGLLLSLDAESECAPSRFEFGSPCYADCYCVRLVDGEIECSSGEDAFWATCANWRRQRGYREGRDDCSCRNAIVRTGVQVANSVPHRVSCNKSKDTVVLKAQGHVRIRLEDEVLQGQRFVHYQTDPIEVESLPVRTEKIHSSVKIDSAFPAGNIVNRACTYSHCGRPSLGQIDRGRRYGCPGWVIDGVGLNVQTSGKPILT